MNSQTQTFFPLENLVTLETPYGTFTWGSAKEWVLFAGPDVIEDEGLVTETALEIKNIVTRLKIPWILKCSYDKANRQSLESFRGPGMKKALEHLERIKVKVGCALLTDVHETWQIGPVSEVADVIQIPAFLSRQTDLVVEAARTGKVIHIKKGQFLAPWDMGPIARKAVKSGNHKVLLCERGTTFGYNRLINDMTGLVEMRKLGFPVIFDATHSTQLPGATGSSSGGRREMVWPLARAAMAVGVDGIFLETHPNPDQALCDGPTSLPLSELPKVLKNLNNIFKSHYESDYE
ncbi:MAG: 3-deoxy-8-phosphooctulonate synthase [Bdellovibrionaceae bacterium]|nr:3-deoxy-8-phosphooctulonate synthase [Pseudobdellovibrionaceae bacterium]MDW8190595.1 3-deoxy-8-phosphooctulonate synthase [Pseudobdellovibrionaceae bacterium]